MYLNRPSHKTVAGFTRRRWRKTWTVTTRNLKLKEIFNNLLINFIIFSYLPDPLLTDWNLSSPPYTHGKVEENLRHHLRRMHLKSYILVPMALERPAIRTFYASALKPTRLLLLAHLSSIFWPVHVSHPHVAPLWQNGGPRPGTGQRQTIHHGMVILGYHKLRPKNRQNKHL